MAFMAGIQMYGHVRQLSVLFGRDRTTTIIKMTCDMYGGFLYMFALEYSVTFIKLRFLFLLVHNSAHSLTYYMLC